jgi:hypothetical protein
VVDDAMKIVRKVASTWKVDTLFERIDELEKNGAGSESVKGLKKIDAEFLSNYWKNVTEAHGNQERYYRLWGTYLIFRKKATAS